MIVDHEGGDARRSRREALPDRSGNSGHIRVIGEQRECHGGPLIPNAQAFQCAVAKQASTLCTCRQALLWGNSW